MSREKSISPPSFEPISGGLYDHPGLSGTYGIPDRFGYQEGWEDTPELGVIAQHEADISQERAEKLFELPEVLRGKKREARLEDGYDAYMDQQLSPWERASRQQEREERDALGTVTTHESLYHAKSDLSSALSMDLRLQKIIRDQGYQSDPGHQDLSNVVDALRTDKQLRVAVGKHFLAKTLALMDEHILIVPSRVVRNNQKVPKGLQPVPNLTSTEYVALLCVSMLDGTFDRNKAKSDPIVEQDGEVTLGQHRATADLVMKGYYVVDEDGTTSPHMLIPRY